MLYFSLTVVVQQGQNQGSELMELEPPRWEVGQTLGWSRSTEPFQPELFMYELLFLLLLAHHYWNIDDKVKANSRGIDVELKHILVGNVSKFKD